MQDGKRGEERRWDKEEGKVFGSQQKTVVRTRSAIKVCSGIQLLGGRSLASRCDATGTLGRGEEMVTETRHTPSIPYIPEMKEICDYVPCESTDKRSGRRMQAAIEIRHKRHGVLRASGECRSGRSQQFGWPRPSCVKQVQRSEAPYTARREDTREAQPEDLDARREDAAQQRGRG